MTTERETWLANLKPGDEVSRQMTGGWGTHLHVDFGAVKRRTANYIFLNFPQSHNDKWEQKFRASDGREPGHGMYMLPELKEQLAQQARRQGLLKRIDSIKWDSLGSDALDSILALAEGKSGPLENSNSLVGRFVF